MAWAQSVVKRYDCGFVDDRNVILVYLCENKLDRHHRLLRFHQLRYNVVVEQSDLLKVLNWVDIYSHCVPHGLRNWPGSLIRIAGKIAIVAEGLVR